VKLVAVKRLDEALDYLGVPINKIYQTPYLGLQSFGYAEHSIFFGRDDETAALLSKLWEREQAGKPGALILAASGAGKSSLAQAGLLWALETASRPDYQAYANAAADPIKESLRAKPAFWGETWKPQQVSEYNEVGLVSSIAANWASTQQLSKPPTVENLAQLADALPTLVPKQGRFVWLVDQLEELFTLGFPASAIDAFADFLARLQSQGVWLVALLRNDFYSNFQEHSPADPNKAKLIDVFPSHAHFDLLKPNEAALRHIIEVPAEKADLVFETTTGGYSLADQIAQDLRDGGKDVLPLLQFVLRLVWEDSGKRGSNLLTFEHYQAIGGLHGAIGHSAEAVYEGLDAHTQAALPKILWGLALVREKTTVESGFRYDFSAQPLSIAGYPEGSAGRELIDAFAHPEVRLLVCDADTVRVAHEALFRHWETAKTQLELLREDMAVRERVRHDYEIWLANGKTDDLLLMPGIRLEEGKALLKQREAFLDADLLAYIRASMEAEAEQQRLEQERIQREQAIAEEARQQAELAQARAEQVAQQQTELAEQQTQLAQERQEKAEKLRRKARQLLAAALVSLAAAGVAGWYWYEVGAQKEELAETLARSDFIQGANLMQQGKLQEAFGYLAHAILINRDMKSVALATSILSLNSMSKMISYKHEESMFHATTSNDINKTLVIDKNNSIHIYGTMSKKPISTLKINGKVNFSKFSPNGQEIVVVYDDKIAQIFRSATGESISEPMRHTQHIFDASFNPAGYIMATASGAFTEHGDGFMQIWNAKTGNPITLPIKTEHQGENISVQFSQNGKLILSCTTTTSRVFNAITGESISPTIKYKNNIISAGFSPDGNAIIIGLDNYTTRVMDVESGKALIDTNFEEQTPRSIDADTGIYMISPGPLWPVTTQFSPDGKSLVSYSDYNAIRVWDVSSGKPLSEIMRHEDKITSVKFSPDGRWLASASLDYTVKIWDAKTGQLISIPIRHEGGVRSVSFSSNGQYLVTISNDKTIRVFEIEISKTAATLFRNEARRDPLFSPDGQILATLSNDFKVQLWNVNTGDKIPGLIEHDYIVQDFNFSHNGKLLVTSSNDHTTKVWDVWTGLPVSTLSGHKDIVFSAKFNHDGDKLITASNDNTAIVWDTKTWKSIIPSIHHESSIYSAEFSKSSNFILTSDYDSSKRVLDAITGSQVLYVSQSVGAIFTPDEHGLAIVSEDTDSAKILSIPTGKQISLEMRHAAEINTIEFSRNGKWIVTASNDDTARVWNAITGQQVSIMQYSADVNSAHFSSDGERVITASKDCTVQIWDRATGYPLNVPIQHKDEVSFAGFNPNGKQIVTSSWDGYTRLWEIPEVFKVGHQFPEFLQKFSGFHINNQGSLESTRLETKADLHNWFMMAQDLSPEARHLIEWLLSDPLERTVTPNGKQTVKERVQQLIGIDTLASLNEALDYWPGHTMALAKLAAVTLRDGKPEEREANIPRARLWANLALKYAPDDASVRAIAEPVLRDTALPAAGENNP
jgi:WD40 repeat protein